MFKQEKETTLQPFHGSLLMVHGMIFFFVFLRFVVIKPSYLHNMRKTSKVVFPIMTEKRCTILEDDWA